jgi:hypothetical protein
MNKNYIILYLIGLFLLIIKIYLIEIDPPKWDIAYYQPVDEQYYVYPALNLFETGSIINNDKIVIFGNPWLTNFATYVSLVIFGDNFYGLRLSSLFFSLVAFSFFFLILKRLTSNIFIFLPLILFFALNYNYSLASTIVEPTIARAAVMLASIYIFIKYKSYNNNAKWIFTGIIVSSLWLFVYPTNAFLVLSVFIYLVLDFMTNKKVRSYKKLIKSGGLIILGLLLTLILYGVFSYTLRENPFNFLDRGQHYSDRVGLTIKGILMNIFNLSKSNLFLFNPAFLLIVVISLITVSYKTITSKVNHTLLIIYSFCIAFILQSFFINDFSQRKLIILLPLLLFIIATWVDDLIKNSFKKDVLLKISGGSLVLFFIVVFLNLTEILVLNKINLILSFAILPFILAIQLNRKKIKVSFLWTFVLLVFIEVINTYHFSLKNKTYHYKEASIKLQEFKSANFIGGFSMGFRVNNDIKTYYNPYLYYGEKELLFKRMDSLAKSNNIVDYTIGYDIAQKDMKKIGFIPYDTLMKKEETIYEYDWLIYQEINTNK